MPSAERAVLSPADVAELTGLSYGSVLAEIHSGSRRRRRAAAS